MADLFERKCILVVDDHVEIVRTLVMNFRARGYRTLAAGEAKTALAFISEMNPDAMILDLGLPDMDGADLIVQLRKWSSIPILVLSGRTELEKKLGALNAGADDYISKPFEIEELVARVETVFRRTHVAVSTPLFTMGKWNIDLASHRIYEMGIENSDVHLTPIEWKVFEVLITNAGGLVPQKVLLQEVWGETYEKETNYLRLYISQLRKKLEPNPQLPMYILTEAGIGYRLLATSIEQKS